MYLWSQTYSRLLGIFAGLVWLALSCTLEAPIDQSNTNTNTNTNTNPGTTPKLAVTWQFRPPLPLPNLPASLTLQIKTADGKLVSSGKVHVVATWQDQKQEWPLVLNAEGFGASGIMLKTAGEWEFTATIELDGSSQTIKQKLSVRCNQGGTDGAACCQDTECSNGLSCVFGTCRKDLNAGNQGCYEGNDCQSKTCENNVCVAGSCTDGTQNGRETAVDCGGSCGPCAVNQTCQTNQDCSSARCVNNRCALPPGSLLGTGDGSPTSVTWTVISNKGMSDPTGLAFHPKQKNELWITNRVTDSFTVIFSTGQRDQTQGTYLDRSEHFMEEVMGLSFDGQGYTGTCGDSTNTYGGMFEPNFFMGPATWSDNVNKLISAGRSIDVTHLDMLHSSPKCMGIVAAGKHQFFVFNGALGTIDWYDFKEPHVPGGDDHSDGIKRRYYSPKLSYVKGVPSGLVYDKENKWVYIADTGSGRILRLDISQANQAGVLTGEQHYSFPYDGVLYRMSGDKTTPLVDFPGPLRAPSGLLLHEDVLYVSDHKSGKLFAFDREGKLLRSLDSGLGDGALSGITVNPSDNRLYLVDRKSNRILRIDP